MIQRLKAGPSKTVILAGSGHAHLEVIQALSRSETTAHKFILVSPHRQTYYSGLMPRLISGDIDAAQLTIHSADFARNKGIEFIQDSVQSVDQANNIVSLKSGRKLSFDLLSLNVGGTPVRLPTESALHTIYLRPFDEFMAQWQEAQKYSRASTNPRFVVVGGGAAAVEVAVALRKRPHKCEVHLVTQSSRLCESYAPKISASILKSLLEFQIQVHLNEPVREILSKHIKLRNDEKLEFDSIFIVTPTKPSKITGTPVDADLRSSQNIFELGDGTTMQLNPQLPRSGVIAVHQGRHLIKSIRKKLQGKSIADFKVPAKQLNILTLGENSARLVWGDLSFEGTWPLRMKNWIDENYMKKFKS